MQSAVSNKRLFLDMLRWHKYLRFEDPLSKLRGYKLCGRKMLEKVLEEVLVSENLVQRMLACQKDLDATDSMFASVQTKLRKAEETRNAVTYA